MSFDYIAGTIPVLDIQGLPCLGEYISAADSMAGLAEAVALLNAGGTGEVAGTTQNLNILEFTEGAEASFDFYDHHVISPDGGGGYIEIYEPAISAPEGFDADDLYAVEFILDSTTGGLTINLYFNTDPLDHQMSEEASSGSGLGTMDGLVSNSILGDPNPAQAGPAAGSRCTITITQTTTQTSPSSSFSFKGGIVTCTSSSGGTSVSTTKTVSIEGELINGRCVARNRR